MSMRTKKSGLKKELTLFDVYAICTGAMFSSGFFLLPGVAFAHTGRSVVIAYLLSGLLILPAMLSMSELSTAMPRAGGAYFFLDRSFGPMVGTVGGLGTWMAMVLKTSFAFIGIGAYLGLVLHWDVTSLALVLTAVFLVLNVVGAKEASWVQRLLVVALVAILALFVVAGLFVPGGVGGGGAGSGGAADMRSAAAPYLSDGLAGLLSTIGLVFVSYAGLTKVSSVAEEVDNPDRNIPLGMALSLLSATVIYAIGAYILVEVIDPVALGAPDLTPVATAAEVVFDWMPGPLALTLVVVAAMAAFASTGNAGILSGSRYLMALSRDHRLPPGFARVGRFHTPTLSVIATAAAVVVCIVTLDVEGVAKLASSFQLVIFSLVNLAVIVMRESRLHSYQPGFRSPLYPWMQIAGVVIPFLLVAEMGHQAIVFTFTTITACLVWYLVYSRGRVEHGGAIYHVFARLARGHMQAAAKISERFGEMERPDVDLELRTILQEKGLHEQDPYDEVVARAFTMDVTAGAGYRFVALEAARLIARRTGQDADTIAEGLLADNPFGQLSIAEGVALPHVRLKGLEQAELVLVRCREGLRISDAALVGVNADVRAHADTGGLALDRRGESRPGESGPTYHAIVCLVSPQDNPRVHLRLLAHMALCLERDAFLEDWLAAERPQELRETLLRHERFLSLRLQPETRAGALIGTQVRDLGLPRESLVAAIRRDAGVVFPRGSERFVAGDRITIVGSPVDIRALHDRFVREV
jgi:amino acid transporter